MKIDLQLQYNIQKSDDDGDGRPSVVDRSTVMQIGSAV